MKRYFFLILAVVSTAMGCMAQSAKSDELFGKGVDLYKAEKYHDAIKFFEQVDCLDRAEMDSTSNRLNYSSTWIASCWFKLNDIDKAKQYDGTSYHLPPIDRRLTAETDSLTTLALTYANQNPYKSLEYLTQIFEKETAILGEDGYWHIGTLYGFAVVNANMGKADEAISYLLKAYDEMKRWYRDDYDYTSVCIDLYNIHFNTGRFDECEQWIDRAEESVVRIHGKASTNYEIIFLTRFQLAIIKKDWERCERLVKDQLKNCEKIYGKNATETCNMLTWVANYYTQAGRHSDAQHWYSEVNKRISKKRDDDEKRSMQFVADIKLAKNHIDNREFGKAEKICNNLLKETQNRADSTEAFVYWTALSLKATTTLFNKKKVNDYITYDHYLQAKQDLGPLSFLVGYFYVAGNVSKNEFETNDSTLRVLREVTPIMLQSVTNDLIQSASTYSDLSMLYAVHNQTSVSRAYSSESAAMYRRLIDMPSVSHTYGQIENSLNQNIGIIRTLINKEDTRLNTSKHDDKYLQHDSISYALHKIKANLLECKLLLDLKIENGNELINDDFREFDVDMSIYCRDSIHCRDFMKEYLELSKHLEEKDPYTYASLRYRYADVLPKGSEESKTYYEDLLTFLKEIGSGWYEFTLEEYYKSIGDHKALVQLTLDKFKDNDDLGNNTIRANIYMREDMLDEAIASIEAYFSLYPDPEVILSSSDWWNVEKFIFYLLEKAPEKGYDTIRQLLRKANEADRKDDFVNIAAILLNDRYKLDIRENDKLRQFMLNELEKYPIYNEDPVLRKHLKLYTTQNTYTPSYEIFSMLLDYAYKDTDDPFDDAEFVYTYAMYCAYDEADFAAQSLRTTIAYFEGNESLIKTEEYKTLLITLFNILNVYEDAEEIIELNDKINSATPEKQLCNQFHEKYNIEEKTPGILKLDYRQYKDNIDLDRLSTALMQVKRDGELQDVLVTKFKSSINQINSDLKSSYKSWDDTAEKASKLMSEAAQYACYHTDCDSLAILAYDTSMLCKGMLLRAEGGLYSMLGRSDNATITAQFNKMQELRQQLEEARKAGDNTKDLQKQYNRARMDMISAANSLGNFTNVLELKSGDVASRLNANDAAIEFTTYGTGDNITYCALLLKGGNPVPKVMYLTNNEALQAIESPYTTLDIYKNIWLMLENELDGIENIYFSPTGMLHQIAIEYVPMPDGRLISEKYNIYRLSNTAELLKQHNRRSDKQTTMLYGGIEYEEDDDMKTAPTDYLKRSRLGIDYLPGTKEEVYGISLELQDSQYNTEIVTGREATEESVKALSGSETSVLHLATHGFYTPREEAESEAQATDALQRSGLFMAGAASTLYGETKKPEDIDGILTAKDIADLDLAATDLVVLSACQTALGEVSGEGVFGLQRGFKKAGVNSILMSLWPVDDEATQILMTRFYHNLAANSSKREALKEAQSYLRDVEDGYYDDPEYWAAFILLDAIN